MTCRNAADDQPTVSTLMQGMSSAAKGLPGRRNRVFNIDAAAGILDHRGGNAFAVRVLGRVAHAEIESESGQKNAREVPAPADIRQDRSAFCG